MTMVSDEQIYRDMCGEVSTADIAHMNRVLLAWADTLDRLERDSGVRPNLRIVFLACVQTIGTMGPAYCKIAATTLMKKAREND
jgi:hypothetical protein